MSSKELAIKVDSLSKCYRIGLKEKMHDSFVRTIYEYIKSPFNNYKKHRSLYKFDDIPTGINDNLSDIIWALKDLSFEVYKGEALGIIGKNGAGKSTLLKVLSRITEPTKGRVEIRGKNASLLEVGTGFHRELTGRDNIYLNGTVLGMNKKEIDHKFSDIVDFSGVGKFIDTPVKRYSSGMQVRLAFSVAAHLEPEILIVDEVLAVGDAEFQAKCIGRMNSVTKSGRTVLFVSHNMGAIADICSRVLWIDEGALKYDGDPLEVVSKYLTLNTKRETFWEKNPNYEISSKQAFLRRARVLINDIDKESAIINFNEQVVVDIDYEIKSSARSFRSYILVKDATGNLLFCSHDTDGSGYFLQNREPGIYTSTCVFPSCIFRPGKYFVSIGICGKPIEDFEEEHVDALCFQISASGYYFNNDPRKGIITPFLPWKIKQH